MNSKKIVNTIYYIVISMLVIILVNKYRKIKEKNLIVWHIKKGCSIK